MFEETYKTIERPSSGLFTDRGSKFISRALPVKTESGVKEALVQVKKEQPKANHHCYAFRLGPSKAIFRYSDDREPAGTAGKPIFGIILSHDLTDLVIVVSRIFGGSLLGVPGLINAYRAAALSAIENAQIVTSQIMEKYRLRFDYGIQHEIMDLLKKSEAAILSRQESEDCTLDIELAKSNSGKLLERIRKHHLLTKHCEITAL